MKIRPVITAIIILFLSSDIYAAIRVYMLPMAEITGHDIFVRDICKLEGPGAVRILNCIIPPELYNDNIIDKEELKTFLSSDPGENISVFGNGTKIIFSEKNVVKDTEQQLFTIKKGETVRVEMKNGNIIIVLQGKSLDNGSIDDQVDVKLKNGKKVRCIVTGEKQVRMII